ncbi:rRNA N6-adenosine-methyltransferase ZCCHC4 [Anabrus simplex]|uniref:rRNA N6-adenosine-methyltransferase ZCCHC4 n=1 Tax=Anabrus simplex TaxID=316456 RepID=UPI0035A2CDD7
MEDQYLDVIMDDLDSHPHCPHGPTLLFRRVRQGKERRFYACAACRDRKLCSFFHWADEEFSDKKRKLWDLERDKLVPEESHAELYRHFCKVRRKVSSSQASYCHTCSKLLLPHKVSQHAEHDVLTGITLHQLLHPSELLKPLETNTKEAQYLFSRKTTQTIIKAARNIGVKYFICIGTPRVHEFVNAVNREDLHSLLLDIDKRFLSFSSPQEFCWFNSFNNHFFHGDSSKNVFVEYLGLNGGEGMMMVMDPPFGGRIEPLSHTIKEIQKLHRQLNPSVQEDMRVMFISPYFMEPHILASFPDLRMLDYKVAYDNHPLFSQGKKARKLGSPVRIFTNILPKEVPLPEDEGYWFCKPCERWVSEENRHCDDCMQCTSKNGHTYVHCFKCQRCVKPSWKHCDRCKRCCLVPHTCGAFAPSGVCYKCGDVGHKKYDCSKEGADLESTMNRKRKHKQKKKKCKKSKRESGKKVV